MCDQGRALIRMWGAPLVENQSLPFIRPPPPSCHPSVKIGGGSDGILWYIHREYSQNKYHLHLPISCTVTLKRSSSSFGYGMVCIQALHRTYLLLTMLNTHLHYRSWTSLQRVAVVRLVIAHGSRL